LGRVLYYKQVILNEIKMTTPEMLDYIKRQHQAGRQREEISQALRQSGWQDSDIQEGLNSALGPASETGDITSLPAGKLPSAMEILKQAWEIYQNRFWLLLGISAAPALIVLAFGAIFGGGAALAGKTGANPFLSLGFGLVLMIVLIITMIYVGVWSSVAELFAIKDQAENIGFQEAFKRGRPYINNFFSTGLLAGLAVLGGFILLIVPGIIFALWFSQACYIVINENLSNTAALKKSKAYMKGRVWEVFLKYLFIGLVVYGGLAVISLGLGGIALALKTKSENISWISNVLSFVIAPLVTTYGYMLYKHLKGEKV